MPHIDDRRRAGRGWVVRWRTSDGREHSKSFPLKTKAEDYLVSVGADLVRGDYVDPTAGKVQLNDWSARWFAVIRPTLKPSTVESYESLLRSRILPRFGTTRVGAIRPSDVQEWVARMTEEGLSPSRIRKCVVVLKMALDAAVRDGMIRSNPAVGTKQPRIERVEAAYLTPEIVDELADAMPTNEYRLLIQVLGILGPRFGEAAGLTRQDVDFLRRRLHVRDSVTEVGGRLVRTATKSYATRQLPLPPTLAETLRVHLETVEKTVDAPIFRAPSGGPLRYRAFHGRTWTPTLKRLGLPTVGLHVLRHSAAARMISAGASAKAVQTVLGHRSAAFTLTVYGHLFDTDLDDLAARLESPAGRSRDGLTVLSDVPRAASA